jgi:hypothetical protein
MLRKQTPPKAPPHPPSTELAKDQNPARPEPRHIETAEHEKFDHLADRESAAEDRQEALLDEAIEETFPGSDPISPKHIT